MKDYIQFITEAWGNFICTGQVCSKVRREIADSWIRCRKYGVDPYNGKGSVEFLLFSQKSNAHLKNNL